MIGYFDSSAFVKLLIDEPASDVADQLWDACDLAVSSRLAFPEVRAALTAAGRNHRLNASQVLVAERDWVQFWESVRVVELTADVASDAGRLARQHDLSGADAVHLASALAIDSDALGFASWDRRLRIGAAEAGLAVVPNR